MNKKSLLIKILPVLFGFFIMGFVDIIGIAINYIKVDFVELSDSVVNMLATSCFLWFLLFSVPTSMLMNKYGRKNIVLLSFIIQAIALGLIFLNYSYTSILIIFAVIGIGNTILQVALNPLVTDVVASNKLTGTLTLGQFVKAICSFTGPLLVSFFVLNNYEWKTIFIVYSVISLIGFIWLISTPIKENTENIKRVSFPSILRLLQDKRLLPFFIGILVLVSVDVSINITFPKFLLENNDIILTEAGLGNSVYFFARAAGALLGGILLMSISEVKFYRVSVWLALLGLILMLVFSHNVWLVLLSVGLFGLGYSNLFAIIFSLSMQKFPKKENEISAILIMGVSGGAILPPIIGKITDMTQNQSMGIITILIVWLYMVWLTKKIA
ncbi:MFS transporter [Limibacterium fermenti]|uniref:MFS transporter n=1 Tax=Limibacterium fermenti TaxID=3229863 RepID=UPI003A625341